MTNISNTSRLSDMSAPVWLITAASSGFGKQIAIEALKHGHRVIATARSSKKISDLQEKGAVTMDLDVIQPLDELKAIVKQAYEKFGRIDLLFNAAGYVLEAAIEEARYAVSFEGSSDMLANEKSVPKRHSIAST